MFILLKYNKYHSDWKEDNILIFYNDIYNFDQYYKLKLNDFGYSSSNWLKLEGFTKFYVD